MVMLVWRVGGLYYWLLGFLVVGVGGDVGYVDFVVGD